MIVCMCVWVCYAFMSVLWEADHHSLLAALFTWWYLWAACPAGMHAEGCSLPPVLSWPDQDMGILGEQLSRLDQIQVPLGADPWGFFSCPPRRPHCLVCPPGRASVFCHGVFCLPVPMADHPGLMLYMNQRNVGGLQLSLPLPDHIAWPIEVGKPQVDCTQLTP